MKNRPFHQRLQFALSGIKNTLKSEASFRTQVTLSCGAISILLIIQPSAIWCAIFFLAIGCVLSAELINTALENMMDRLHPEVHPVIAKAKDCAAGAVLILSLMSVCILLFLLYDKYF
ncbi:MAG: diacylglycerol kinase [Oligoflexia bacterium]|nr:diacylglycerol kinase [Oligoflexia bacterium]